MEDEDEDDDDDDDVDEQKRPPTPVDSGLSTLHSCPRSHVYCSYVTTCVFMLKGHKLKVTWEKVVDTDKSCSRRTIRKTVI